MNVTKVNELRQLVSDYNKGADAFWRILEKYPDAVKSVLGKDEYLTNDNCRAILGNQLKIKVPESLE